MSDDKRQRDTARPQSIVSVPRPTPFVPNRHLPAVPERPTKPDAPRSLPDRQRIDETAASVRASVERRQSPPQSPPPSAPTRPQEPVPVSVSPELDRAIGRATRGILAKLWPALLAAVLGGAGSYAVQRAESPPERVDRQEQRVRELERDLRETREDLARTKGEVRALREYNAEYQAWAMALEQARGVRVRQPEGAAPLPALETSSPISARRRVLSPPALTVSSPPPSPP